LDSLRLQKYNNIKLKQGKNMNKFIKIIGILILFTVLTMPLIAGISIELPSNIKQSYSKKLEIEQPKIMLTGYWNPTGQMIVPFSNDSYLNPDGWKGDNWENRGYDIYSFFPNPGIYNGTFEVDYQATWNDFWNITDQIKPIAIISFGAGAGPWEIEFNARNLLVWANDYKPPYQPTPCPPDDTVPTGFIRHSTLPAQEIEDAVNIETSVNAWVDWDDNPGAFLCEYMAYLGMWYQSIHKNDNLNPCKSAGFIHVNSNVNLTDAIEATNVTIRETIKYVDCVKTPPDAPVITGSRIGKVGKDIEYKVVTDDPDSDEIFLFINWGDGQIEKWLGPFQSGEKVKVTHNWSNNGFYEIKVIAKDNCGALSSWGNFLIFISKDKMIHNFSNKKLILHLPIIENY
jgi:pyrrolidone-carboxylate peptidase